MRPERTGASGRDPGTSGNVAYYRRHGFEVREEIPKGAPHMWLMWREPRDGVR